MALSLCLSSEHLNPLQSVFIIQQPQLVWSLSGSFAVPLFMISVCILAAVVDIVDQL